METNLLVEGFYTALDHIFATRYLPEPNEKGETVLERYNGGGATVAGVNVEAKAAFFALNVKLAYEFPILRTLTLQLNAGVQNLFDSYQSDFDQGWERDSGYVYGPSLPRSWFVGAKIRF